MKTINSPEIDKWAIGFEIYNSKKQSIKAIVKSNFSTIRERYDYYTNQFNQIYLLNPLSLTTDQKKAFLSFYSSSTIPLSKLKTEIFKNNISELHNICPYCGIGQPETIDHYLPQEDYPEFCVLPMNLIPCCHKCNNKKDRNWKAFNNNRDILNFYHDSFFGNQFLFVKYEIVDNVPIINFYLEKSGTISDDEFEIVTNHFQNINLITIYNDKYDVIITDLKRDILSGINTGLDDNTIKQMLLNKATIEESDFGINHWRTILKRKVASDSTLYNSIKNSPR